MILRATHTGEDYGVVEGRQGTLDPVEWEVPLGMVRAITTHGPLLSVSEIEKLTPAKTSIQQTKSKEFYAGAAYIIDLINKGLREVKRGS